MSWIPRTGAFAGRFAVTTDLRGTFVAQRELIAATRGDLRPLAASLPQRAVPKRGSACPTRSSGMRVDARFDSVVSG